MTIDQLLAQLKGWSIRDLGIGAGDETAKALIQNWLKKALI